MIDSLLWDLSYTPGALLAQQKKRRTTAALLFRGVACFYSGESTQPVNVRPNKSNSRRTGVGGLSHDVPE